MNIVQQLLSSNVQTGHSSSRFEFSSRSLSFSSADGVSSTDFGQKLQQKLSTSSREIEFASENREVSIRSQNKSRGPTKDSDFIGNPSRRSEADNERSGENSFADTLGRDRQLSVEKNDEVAITRQGNEEFWIEKNENSPGVIRTKTRGTESGTNTEEQGTVLSSPDNKQADFPQKQKKLLKRIENGEVDLSSQEDLEKVKELVDDVTKEDSIPAKKARVMEALQGFFSNPSKLADQFQTSDTKELKQTLEGLQDLLKSFKDFARQSRADLHRSLGAQVENLLEELDLSRVSDGKEDSSGEGANSKISLESIGISANSSISLSSDGEDSSPTKKLVKTLDEAIKNLEKITQKLGGVGNSSSSLSVDEIAGKIKSYLQDIKKSLEGSGNNQTSSEGSRSFFDQQVQQVMDDLDQKIKDDDLRKKIKSELKKLQGNTDSKKDSKSSSEKQSTNSKSSTSESQNSKKNSGKNASTKKNGSTKAKVKTKAVENKPDQANSFKKSDQSHSKKKGQRTQTKQQTFKVSEQKAQKVSQSKDVIIETNSKQSKADDLKTKTTNNSHNDKLASFETNTARAVDANEHSGTSFSNGNGSNQNSQNNANVKSTVPSYSQRSPEAQKMIDQIVEKAQTVLKDGKQSMRMQLSPESLGEVKMEVSLDANQVSARFKVENSSVKKTLNSSIEQLKQSIQQMGLDVDNVDVSDMSADDGGDEESWFDDSSDGAGRGRGGPGQGEESEEGIPEETQRRRRLREYSTIELVA